MSETLELKTISQSEDTFETPSHSTTPIKIAATAIRYIELGDNHSHIGLSSD